MGLNVKLRFEPWLAGVSDSLCGPQGDVCPACWEGVSSGRRAGARSEGEGGSGLLGRGEGSGFSLHEVESYGPDLYFTRITVAKNKL